MGVIGVPTLETSLPVPSKIVCTWGVRFVLFKMLNISIRSWALSFSPHRFWFLNTEKSRFRNTGRRNVFPPRFPTCPGAGQEKQAKLI